MGNVKPFSKSVHTKSCNSIRELQHLMACVSFRNNDPTTGAEFCHSCGGAVKSWGTVVACT